MLFDNNLDINEMPSYETIYPYLIYALHKEGGGAHGTKVIARVGTLMGLTEEVLEKRSGKNKDLVFEKAVRFTMSRLRTTNHIEPKEFREKGYWYLSKKGEEVVKLLEGDGKYTEAKNLRDEMTPIIDQYLEEQRVARQKDNQPLPDLEDITIEDDDGIEGDLEKIRKMEPLNFERLCIQLLKAMGGKMEETQKTRDGGVDGVGYIEIEFVKFKVVMEAKRFNKDNKIQEKVIRDFLGAIKAKSAEKAVFITTSDFSKKAENLGNEHLITLINGHRLIELMRKHTIGYKNKMELNIDSF